MPAGVVSPLLLLLPAILGLSLANMTSPPAVRADVVFDDCQPTPDGGITCDTHPTGETLLKDETTRFGFFDEASPGWDEFEPYEGYEDMFGGNDS